MAGFYGIPIKVLGNELFIFQSKFEMIPIENVINLFGFAVLELEYKLGVLERA